MRFLAHTRSVHRHIRCVLVPVCILSTSKSKGVERKREGWPLPSSLQQSEAARESKAFPFARRGQAFIATGSDTGRPRITLGGVTKTHKCLNGRRSRESVSGNDLFLRASRNIQKPRFRPSHCSFEQSDLGRRERSFACGTLPKSQCPIAVPTASDHNDS